MSIYVRKPFHTFVNSPGLPFKMYIIFSFGMHDANLFAHQANVGDSSSFQYLALRFIGYNECNSNKFKLTFIGFQNKCITYRVTLGSAGIVTPVVSLRTCIIDPKDDLRQGQG